MTTQLDRLMELEASSTVLIDADQLELLDLCDSLAPKMARALKVTEAILERCEKGALDISETALIFGFPQAEVLRDDIAKARAAMRKELE